MMETMMNDKEPTPRREAPFSIDAVALARVVKALGGSNVGSEIEACAIRDVKHVVKVLAGICVFEEVAPGFIAAIFDEVLPNFIREHSRQIVGVEAQRRADAAGFGAEWAGAIRAGKSKDQAGYKAALVRVYMAATGASEEQAAASVADHYDIDPESVRRALRRAKRKGQR